ncbi:MAG: AMP-binding protein [Pirellulales bacterium]|nr:AMP-binding protein [Pirellulales bacterium]
MTRTDSNIAHRILSGKTADAPALYCGERIFSYGELRAAAHRRGRWLLDEHAAPRECVGIWAENGSFFVAAYLGTIRAGCCAVPFQLDATEKSFASISLQTGMKRLLIASRFRPRVEPWAKRLGVQLADENSALPPPPGESFAWPKIDPVRDPAAIVFTSGSTGESKGVAVSHRNIECNTRDIVKYLGLSPDDRTMVVLPFYYCYGASLLHTHLAAGASLVLNNGFMFPEKVLDEMERKCCTGFAGVPSTYQILLRKTRFARRKFPVLRWLQQAGGKLPNAFIREIREAFPQVKFFTMYGQTEATARLSYLPPDRLDDKLGSIGKGLPSTRLEVLKEDGTPVRPGSEEIGEIVASGENVALGYWNDPEETRRYFRGGKLYTGDMARVDADGFIFIVERTRDFIKAMGNRVGPKEIEEVLCEMPEVVEAAVIGVPDEIWGEAIKAYIVPAQRDRIAIEDVRLHCLKLLPNYKAPQYIEFLPCLPKTANGKVAKEDLRKMNAACGFAKRDR